VIEYVGEVVDGLEFEARTQKYAKDGHEHHYFMMLNNDRIIDATMYGNDSRFINHSCDPNCVVEKVCGFPALSVATVTTVLLIPKDNAQCYAGVFNTVPRTRRAVGTHSVANIPNQSD